MKRQKYHDLIVMRMNTKESLVTIPDFEWDPSKRYFMDGDMLYYECKDEA